MALHAELVGGAAGGFDGLESAVWWQQLAREANEEDEVDYEYATDEEDLVELSVGLEAERAAQEAMRLRTGGRAHYGGLVGRRVLGEVANAWGSAAKPGLATSAAAAVDRVGRSSRRDRRRRQPQQSLRAAANLREAPAASGGGCSECKPAGNRFAVLAAAESEEETFAQPALGVHSGEGDPTRTQQHYFSEAEAEQELEELLNGWVHSCPVVGGSTRQAACEEIEARLAWLPSQATVHPGAAWKAAVDRQLASCAAALLALRRPAPRRAP